MGSFDGAECCELVGLYMLSQLQHININVGLFRDDGLGVSQMTRRQTELAIQEISRIFKLNDLSITSNVNHKQVDYLDVNLDLSSGLFKPYKKENDCPIYIHKHSNHPPTIIKNIPESVNRRLCSISSNAAVFREETTEYQTALANGGHTHKIEFTPPTNNTKKRNRGRKITWINPPYSANVATNIGAKFLRIVDKCFPPAHPLSKIINRNTVKISYRCMPNMSQLLAKHNSKVRNQKAQNPQPGCNCRGGPPACPVEGSCLTEGVVYQASVQRTDDHSLETYTGLTARRFKDRYYEHTADMRDPRRDGTGLSHHVQRLTESNIPYKISWKIISRCPSFNPSTKTCKLCLREKFFIMFRPEGATLNDRSEIFATCRHRLKKLLGNS